MATVSPYSTALKLGHEKPSHIKNPDDIERVTAYWTYTDIFRNIEDAFALVMRDDEGDEISRRFIPSARTIIEATNRYFAVDPVITPNPLIVAPDGSTVEADDVTKLQLMKLWNDFAIREEFFAKYMSLKRWTLVRADGILHLMADDTKPEGQRLRIVELDPATYFTIKDPLDAERVVGVYIVTIVDDDAGDPIAQRQSYLKLEDGKIQTRLEFFETDGWDDRPPLSGEDLKPLNPPQRFSESALLAGFVLPDPITSIPVYHFRNNRAGTEPFGVSEIQGIETLLAGIHQTATDQDVTIALAGIGVYVTTSGKPKNADGTEAEWVIAPASIIELESVEDKFERVKGVDSVQPLLDHSGYLAAQARETTGTPDVAIGKVDVQVAQSGIALAIQFSPILSKNQEKEVEFKNKTDQLLYDVVTMWFPAFESFQANGITLGITFGDPLPVNRKEVLEEVVTMVKEKLVSIEFGQQILREKLGYDIPTDMLQRIVAEQEQLLDATGARISEEASGPVE